MTDLPMRIHEANKQALERIVNSTPVLVDIKTAGEFFPDMQANWVFHSGPPIGWEDMTGSARGAIMGALQYEGLAKTADEAMKLAASGEILFRPNHEMGGVGGMSGIITHSTPLYIIENSRFGITAYAGLLAGPLIFGGFDEKTLRAVRWTNTVLAPALREAVRLSGGVNIKRIQAEALHMNDEMHNRSNAATALFAAQMSPFLVEAVDDRDMVGQILRFWNDNPGFFTFIGMGACKATMMAAHNIEFSSIVTVMSRNGVEFGIWVSGLGNRWFTGPAARVQGPVFPGYQDTDAERDIGDSCITETAGLGAFVLAGAPAILRLVGETMEEARRSTSEMYEITAGENPHFTIPALDFRPAPVGIDIRKVVETDIVPVIDTAMAHKKPGVGEMVGAGMVVPPGKPFRDAVKAFAERYAD